MSVGLQIKFEDSSVVQHPCACQMKMIALQIYFFLQRQQSIVHRAYFSLGRVSVVVADIATTADAR